MKLHIACLALACLTLAAVPALAQGTVYDNGPVNGQVDGWIINFGYAVSETFQLANNSTVVVSPSGHGWNRKTPRARSSSIGQHRILLQ